LLYFNTNLGVSSSYEYQNVICRGVYVDAKCVFNMHWVAEY